MDKQTLFYEGMEGYASFRIPSVIALPGGRVIAFCEGRLNSMSDYGTIRIVARISQDGGESFGPLRDVASDGNHTVGNPCPVYDAARGRLHLYSTAIARRGEPLILWATRAPCCTSIATTWEKHGHHHRISPPRPSGITGHGMPAGLATGCN